jgi:hypothetical protein
LWAPEIRVFAMKCCCLVSMFMLMFTSMFMQLNRDLEGYFDSRRREVVLQAPDKPFDFASNKQLIHIFYHILPLIASC